MSVPKLLISSLCCWSGRVEKDKGVKIKLELMIKVWLGSFVQCGSMQGDACRVTGVGGWWVAKMTRTHAVASMNRLGLGNVPRGKLTDRCK